MRFMIFLFAAMLSSASLQAAVVEEKLTLPNKL